MTRQKIASTIAQQLKIYLETHQLLGLSSQERLEVFSLQVADSIRRIEFVKILERRDISNLRANPNSSYFDPFRAALYHKKLGNVDEAFWLVFLATHFGKSQKSGWRLCSEIYGALGQQAPWTWEAICNNVDGFRVWYDQAYRIMSADGATRHFSNHRKYETLKPNAARSIPNVFQSYVEWIGGHHSHMAKIEEGLYAVGHDNNLLFEYLYSSVSKNVTSFGRLAAFDLVTMYSKLGLIETFPQIAYLKDATGPRKGASLMLYGHKESSNNQVMERELRKLAEYLQLGDFSMQIMEDSLCNWQKSPDSYQYFKG